MEKKIPTEDILSDDDIVRLVREEACSDNDDDDDSEEEPILISINDALKSLKTWIIFFEQQQSDEFKVEDINVFKKYFTTVQRLELQSRKQVPITNFF